LKLTLNGNETRVELPSRPFCAAYDLVAIKVAPWVELHVVRRSQSIGNQDVDERSKNPAVLSTLQLKVVNKLYEILIGRTSYRTGSNGSSHVGRFNPSGGSRAQPCEPGGSPAGGELGSAMRSRGVEMTPIK
jgi:hypothetical protein